MQTTAHQTALNEVVINKVNRMIENKAVGVQATMERLINEGKIAQDYIAPLGVNLKAKQHNPVITFDGNNGRLLMNMPDGQFNLHANAVSQIAERMGIPTKYLRQLAGGSAWEVALAAYVLNQHSDEDAAQPCPRPQRRAGGASNTLGLLPPSQLRGDYHGIRPGGSKAGGSDSRRLYE